MMLLFDENFSRKPTRLLATVFPNSAHIRDYGLKGQWNEQRWNLNVCV